MEAHESGRNSFPSDIRTDDISADADHGAALYLAEVDHLKKFEISECPGVDCDCNEEGPSPSSRQIGI